MDPNTDNQPSNPTPPPAPQPPEQPQVFVGNEFQPSHTSDGGSGVITPSVLPPQPENSFKAPPQDTFNAQPVAPSPPSPPDFTTSPNIPAKGSSEYISNPFLNGVRGLVLILRVNPLSALLSGLIGLLLTIAIYFFYLLCLA